MSNDAPSGGLLPHHLSESSFRIYEPFLTLGVRNFPDETSWDVGLLRQLNPDIKIGPATFVARFRDAVVSLRRFHWQTTVDVAKLISIAGKFSITIQPGTSILWFKHKGHQGRPMELKVDANVRAADGSASASFVPWKDATLEEIEALCLLITHNRLVGPYIVEQQFRQAEMDHFATRWNVALTWDAERKVTVIT